MQSADAFCSALGRLSETSAQGSEPAYCRRPALSTLEGEAVGGADRDRTGDPLLAKQVLSQLSYSPIRMVGLGRFELPTSPLSGVRSNQLSYRPGMLPDTAPGARFLSSGLREKSFEDQAEHADRLRRPRPSIENAESREGPIQAPSISVRNGGRGVHGNFPLTQARRPARDRGTSERVP